MAVYIPLQGEGGERPKAPSVPGWQSPSYEGVDPGTGGWLGLRTDDYVVVDCDSDAARDAWLAKDPHAFGTWVRKTPRGYHFIYSATPGSPDGPAAGVLPGVDIRAGRTSQIVFDAPGYSDLTELGPRPYNAEWLPKRASAVGDGNEWSEMPTGRGNVTMTAIAGALRKQGMDYQTMLKMLLVTNKLTMTESPMSPEEIELIARSVYRYAPDPDVDEIVFEEEAVAIEAGDSSARYLDSRTMQLSPPPEWLWHPYLPKGRMVLAEGAEGIGKGMFAVWLAMRTVSGAPFADGPTREQAPVVWYSAEDDPQEDILRRLYAAGYDPAAHASVRFFNTRFAPPTFPKDVAELRTVCETLKPGLVILDPGRSFLAPPDGMKDASYNNEAALRPGLQALLQLTYDLGVTIVFVHHWNKKSEGSTRDKSGGSVSFRQVVRHVLVAAQVGTHRAISVEKSNLSATANTVRSFDIAEVEEYETARFALGGELPEYRDLDEWIDTVKKLDAEETVAISWGYDWESAALHYAALAPESMAPTAEQMARELGVDQETAQHLRVGLKDAKIITGHRWTGLPPDLAAKAQRGAGK